MRFDIDRNVDLLSKALPAVQQLHTLRDGAQAHVGLNVDMVRAVFHRVFQHRLQIVDRAWEALPFGIQAVLGAQLREMAHRCAIRVMRAHTIETRLRDHAQVFFKCAFSTIGVTALHCPERLKDEQALSHRNSDIFKWLLSNALKQAF
ncbi:hypothetical protein F3J17_09735 [Burkholderia sp. Ax-1719]|nr:hypothetical protein [Burkholderia sp. Ax-1719]